MMNRKKIILGMTVGLAAVSTLVYFTINNSSKELIVENTESSLETTIKENTEFTIEEKTVSFETAEEMLAYGEQINNIQSEEEGITFIEEFLIESTCNQPETIIGKYHPQFRNTVIKNELFPIYDESGYFDFEIRNLEVSCVDKEENKYEQFQATYEMVFIDRETGEDFYSYTGKDTFNIHKDAGNIYILGYSKNVTNKKELNK